MAAKSCSRVSRGSSENSVDIEDDNPDIIEKVHVIDETPEELEEPPNKKTVSLNVHRRDGVMTSYFV